MEDNELNYFEHRLTDLSTPSTKYNAEMYSGSNQIDAKVWMPTWEQVDSRYRKLTEGKGGEYDPKPIKALYDRVNEDYRQYTNSEFNSYDVDMYISDAYPTIQGPYKPTKFSLDNTQARIDELGLPFKRRDVASYEPVNVMELARANWKTPDAHIASLVKTRDLAQAAKDKYETDGIMYEIDPKTGELRLDKDGKVVEIQTNPEDYDWGFMDVFSGKSSEYSWTLKVRPDNGQAVWTRVGDDVDLYKQDLYSVWSESELASNPMTAPLIAIRDVAGDVVANAFKNIAMVGKASSWVNGFEEDGGRWANPLYRIGANMTSSTNLDAQGGLFDGGYNTLAFVKSLSTSLIGTLAVAAVTGNPWAAIGYGALESMRGGYEDARKDGWNEKESAMYGLIIGGLTAAASKAIQFKTFSSYAGKKGLQSNPEMAGVFKKLGQGLRDGVRKDLNDDATKAAMKELSLTPELWLAKYLPGKAAQAIHGMFDDLSNKGVGKWTLKPVGKALGGARSAYNRTGKMLQSHWAGRALSQTKEEGFEELFEMVGETALKKYYREEGFANKGDSWLFQDTALTPRDKRFELSMKMGTSSFSEKSWGKLFEEAAEAFIGGNIASFPTAATQSYLNRPTIKDGVEIDTIVKMVLANKKADLDKQYKVEEELIKEGKSSLGNSSFNLKGELVDKTKDGWHKETEAYHVLQTVKKKIDYTQALKDSIGTHISKDLIKDEKGLVAYMSKQVATEDVEKEYYSNYLKVYGMKLNLDKELELAGFDKGSLEDNLIPQDFLNTQLAGMKSFVEGLGIDVKFDEKEFDTLFGNAMTATPTPTRIEEALLSSGYSKVYAVKKAIASIKLKLMYMNDTSVGKIKTRIYRNALEALTKELEVEEANYSKVYPNFSEADKAALDKMVPSISDKLLEYQFKKQELTYLDVNELVLTSAHTTVYKEEVARLEKELKEATDPSIKAGLDANLRWLKSADITDSGKLGGVKLARAIQSIADEAKSTMDSNNKLSTDDVAFLHRVISPYEDNEVKNLEGAVLKVVSPRGGKMYPIWVKGNVVTDKAIIVKAVETTEKEYVELVSKLGERIAHISEYVIGRPEDVAKNLPKIEPMVNGYEGLARVIKVQMSNVRPYDTFTDVDEDGEWVYANVDKGVSYIDEDLKVTVDYKVPTATPGVDVDTQAVVDKFTDSQKKFLDDVYLPALYARIKDEHKVKDKNNGLGWLLADDTNPVPYKYETTIEAIANEGIEVIDVKKPIIINRSMDGYTALARTMENQSIRLVSEYVEVYKTLSAITDKEERIEKLLLHGGGQSASEVIGKLQMLYKQELINEAIIKLSSYTDGSRLSMSMGDTDKQGRYGISIALSMKPIINDLRQELMEYIKVLNSINRTMIDSDNETSLAYIKESSNNLIKWAKDAYIASGQSDWNEVEVLHGKLMAANDSALGYSTLKELITKLRSPLLLSGKLDKDKAGSWLKDYFMSFYKERVSGDTGKADYEVIKQFFHSTNSGANSSPIGLVTSIISNHAYENLEYMFTSTINQSGGYQPTMEQRMVGIQALGQLTSDAQVFIPMLNHIKGLTNLTGIHDTSYGDISNFIKTGWVFIPGMAGTGKTSMVGKHILKSLASITAGSSGVKTVYATAPYKVQAEKLAGEIDRMGIPNVKVEAVWGDIGTRTLEPESLILMDEATVFSNTQLLGMPQGYNEANESYLKSMADHPRVIIMGDDTQLMAKDLTTHNTYTRYTQSIALGSGGALDSDGKKFTFIVPHTKKLSLRLRSEYIVHEGFDSHCEKATKDPKDTKDLLTLYPFPTHTDKADDLDYSGLKYTPKAEFEARMELVASTIGNKSDMRIIYHDDSVDASQGLPTVQGINLQEFRVKHPEVTITNVDNASGQEAKYVFYIASHDKYNKKADRYALRTGGSRRTQYLDVMVDNSIFEPNSIIIAQQNMIKKDTPLPKYDKLKADDPKLVARNQALNDLMAGENPNQGSASSVVPTSPQGDANAAPAATVTPVAPSTAPTPSTIAEVDAHIIALANTMESFDDTDTDCN